MSFVLLTEFAFSADYHFNMGEILDKMRSPRWLPECMNAFAVFVSDCLRHSVIIQV